MAAGPEPGWPKLAGFREHIGEFSGDSKEYRLWRNQLENAFVTSKTLASTGQAAAPHCRWSTEFIMRGLAILRTKLKGTALEIFDSKIGTINCYWRSDINGNQNIIDTLKDTTEYPTNLNHPYNGAFDVTATTEGTRCNPYITNATVQRGFREIFDNAFLVDAVQQTAQKDFGTLISKRIRL
ncbi:14408_t:CDS:2 [Gigaspora margarita]|uniref:14408_t:CDS:1 n=1 Tax=Gigaspora margarita TaxID=4874 RepID=A0ABN7WMB1_GIGMA|nr:14408_t:CDS:2 [Gigaspora margarita]